MKKKIDRKPDDGANGAKAAGSRAERTLRQSEKIFSALVENAPFGVYLVDAQFRLAAINAGSREVFRGIEPLLGRDFAEILRILWPEPFATEAIGRFQHTLETGESFLSPTIVEQRANIDEIQSYDWQLHRVALPEATFGVVCYFYDLSTQERLKATVRESEEKLRLLIEGASDYAMFLLDPGNHVFYWNKGAERVFGWTADEVMGKSGELVFTPEDRAVEREGKEMAIALRDGTAPDTRWHLRKDGSRIWVDGVMHRLDDENGELRGFAKVVRDATEQRQAEEELRRSRDELEQRVEERTRELQAMNDTLEDEMERRRSLESEILEVTERERARISQDLHDSLCQELTATAFLLKSRAKKFRREDREASEALEEAAETVNENAELARDLARGLIAFEFSKGGLPSALRDLSLRTNAGKKLTCHCDAPRSMQLEENIAINLYRIAQEALTNVIKHARASEIAICLARERDEAVLSIKDNGRAMPTKKKRSKGMGVHLMQYRARACGGTMKIESKKGEGTKVICRAPVKKSDR